MVLPVLMAAALAVPDGQALDAESQGRLEVVAAALEAARSSVRGFSASMAYSVEASKHVQRYIRPERVVGELIWDSPRVRYAWRESTPAGRLAVCVVRDQLQFFRAARFDDPAHSDFVTFEIRRPLASVGSIATDRLSVGDPAMWFGGATLETVREGLANRIYQNPEFLEEGGCIVFSCRLRHGPTRRIWFDPEFAFLPTRGEKTEETNGKRLTSEERYDWEKTGGVWILQRAEWKDRWIDGRTKQPAESHRLLAFSDVKVGSRFEDGDFSADRLPVPVGSLGVDKRVLPPIDLTMDLKGVVRREASSAQSRSATFQAIGVDEAKEAEAARFDRSIRGWSTAGKLLGALAIAAGAASIAYYRRSRRLAGGVL